MRGIGRLWTRGRSPPVVERRRRAARAGDERREGEHDRRPRRGSPTPRVAVRGTSVLEGLARTTCGRVGIARGRPPTGLQRPASLASIADVSQILHVRRPLRRAHRDAGGARRHRRARLRRAAAGDGLRRGRLRGHRHRPQRASASPAIARAPLLPRRRARRALRRPSTASSRATTDYAAVAELDALTICVPTPLSKTRTPDLCYIVAAAESVAGDLRPGQLVVLQSTTYPGTTEEIVLPILERAGARGRRGLLPRLRARARRPRQPGLDDAQHAEARRAASPPSACAAPSCSTRQIVRRPSCPVSSPMVAETAKLHENTFRAVNIALANELALMCDRLGISAWEVIEAAATKPFAFLPHYPGPGLGGDCIPVVPHFLAWRLREYGYSRAADRGRARGQRAHADLRACRRSPTRSTTPAGRSRARACCCSGWPTRPTSTTRASRRASRSCASCSRAAATSRYCDPWVPELELDERRYAERRVVRARRSRAADCVVVLTAHREFLDAAALGATRGSSSTRATSSRTARTSPASRLVLLILGAGYIGAALAERALDAGEDVVLADNWYATERAQLDGLERARRAGRDRRHPRPRRRRPRCSPTRPDAVCLLAAQASRPLSEREPDYTEETNLTGTRHVAEAVGRAGRPPSSSPARCTSTAAG